MAHPDAEWVTVRPLWDSPEGAVELAERAREIDHAVGALPEEMGRMVTLHYVDGLSYAEIAARLGVPVSTVKGRLFRSRRRLRLALGLAERRPAEGRSTPRRARKKGTAMQHEARSQESARVIAQAEERIAKAAAFYAHWFGTAVGVQGLTDEAQGVIRRATAEAQRYSHNYVGTEHLLLGLVGDEASMPASVLAECGVSLARVRELMDYRLGRGTVPAGAAMSLVPRVQAVVEMAFAEARRLGAPAVGAEHLLLGLLREGSGVAVLVIESLGADVYEVRDRTLTGIDPVGWTGGLRPPPPAQ